MNTITTVADLTAAINQAKQEHKSIGLVPTMGALHEGHLSLVRRARAENDVVVVSVFVNPIQFNNKEDLAKYPRTVEQDCKLLAEAGADIAFVPTVEEMYPEPVNTVYHFGPLEEVMEGPRRPGHFSGVAVVVRRLFDLAQPTRAYFGEKDFQQIAIIRNLLEQIQYPIELVPCPIVRADDGLALSSRNMRLSKEAREVAMWQYNICHLVEGTHGVEVVDGPTTIGSAIGHNNYMVERCGAYSIMKFEELHGHQIAVGSKGVVAGTHKAVDPYAFTRVGYTRCLAHEGNTPYIEVVCTAAERFLTQQIVAE